MKANNLAHTRDGRVVSYLGRWDPTCKKRFELEIVGMDKDKVQKRITNIPYFAKATQDVS